MKTPFRFLSPLLVLTLTLSNSACAAPTDTDTVDESSTGKDSSTELFLSLTEGTSESLSFPLTTEQAAQIEKAGADKVTWTLHRTEPYGDPVDGNFIPIHGEEKMYPNEKETIDLVHNQFISAA